MKSSSLNTPKRKPLIAIVDDEPALLQLYEDILGNDYQVMSFSSPDQFIQFITSHEKTAFDLLLTDLRMPGMSGIDMVKEAQKQGHFFPVILFSGYLDKSSALDAVDIGVCRLLEKPTSPDNIINSIDELLIENDVRNLRKEIRGIGKKLQEYYAYLRLMLNSHLPEVKMPESSLQMDTHGNIIKKESFDELLCQLENQLNKLTYTENILEKKRAARYRSLD